MIEKLDDRQFYGRALKAYDNPHCVSLVEFEEDIARFSYIKKILTRYHQVHEINDRLILNHIVVCFNLFGAEALNLILHKIDREHWGYIFPFLFLLNRLPEIIPEFDVRVTDISLDQEIIKRLRNIK